MTAADTRGVPSTCASADTDAMHSASSRASRTEPGTSQRFRGRPAELVEGKSNARYCEIDHRYCRIGTASPGSQIDVDGPRPCRADPTRISVPASFPFWAVFRVPLPMPSIAWHAVVYATVSAVACVSSTAISKASTTCREGVTTRPERLPARWHACERPWTLALSVGERSCESASYRDRRRPMRQRTTPGCGVVRRGAAAKIHNQGLGY